MEKCDGKLTIENKKKLKMIEELKNRGYPSDPVKAWKKKQIEKGNMDENSEEQTQPTEGEEEAPSGNLDYDYLLGMTMWTLTLERKEELINKKNQKVQELEDLRMKTPGDIWTDDLKALREKVRELDELEENDVTIGGAGATSRKRRICATLSDSLENLNPLKKGKFPSDPYLFVE